MFSSRDLRRRKKRNAWFLYDDFFFFKWKNSEISFDFISTWLDWFKEMHFEFFAWLNNRYFDRYLFSASYHGKEKATFIWLKSFSSKSILFSFHPELFSVDDDDDDEDCCHHYHHDRRRKAFEKRDTFLEKKFGFGLTRILGSNQSFSLCMFIHLCNEIFFFHTHNMLQILKNDSFKFLWFKSRQLPWEGDGIVRMKTICSSILWIWLIQIDVFRMICTTE